MLMYSEAAIRLIWSRVGRLTVDMGPPRAGGAGRGPAAMDEDVMGEEEMDEDGGDGGRRVETCGCATAGTARCGVPRSPMRVVPSPTSSAIAPPRTAAG